jgi:hypothetical protein
MFLYMMRVPNFAPCFLLYYALAYADQAVGVC